jgi:RimJ/RimL family protein N-acetyltransferase
MSDDSSFEFHYIIPEVETPQLRLRALTDADIGDFAEMLCDPKAMEHDGGPMLPEMAQRYGRSRLVLSEHLRIPTWAVTLKPKGEFVGTSGFTKGIESRFQKSIRVPFPLQLVYGIQHRFWRNGFATEAAKACLCFSKRQFPSHAVVAFTSRENKASQRVLEKVCFARVEEIDSPANQPALMFEFADQPT